MTDIVKRIKLAAKVFNFTRAGIELLQDCADEITRLRAENETLRRDVKTAVMGDSAELQDVKRENETLREALNDIYKEFIETEGFTMKTYLEDDLWHKIKRMARIAAKNKRAAAATIRESGE